MTERGWTRGEIEAHIAALRDEHDGSAFVEAIARFSAESLAADERRVLGEILLERANETAEYSRALDRRLEEGGWLRRTLRKMDERAQRERPRRR